MKRKYFLLDEIGIFNSDPKGTNLALSFFRKFPAIFFVHWSVHDWVHWNGFTGVVKENFILTETNLYNVKFFQGMFMLFQLPSPLPLLVGFFNILVHTTFDLFIQFQKGLKTSLIWNKIIAFRKHFLTCQMRSWILSREYFSERNLLRKANYIKLIQFKDNLFIHRWRARIVRNIVVV